MKPEMLTAEEIEDLRRDLKQKSEYFRKAFAHLRPAAAQAPENTNSGKPE